MQRSHTNISLGKQTYKVSFDPLGSTLKQTLQKEEYRLFVHLHKKAANAAAPGKKFPREKFRVGRFEDSNAATTFHGIVEAKRQKRSQLSTFPRGEFFPGGAAAIDTGSIFPPLLQLHQKYPNAPEIINLLTFVYLQKKEVKKAEELIIENYAKNPTDLFARINYADQCLRKGIHEHIPTIFENQFDLHLLYPKKEIFHYSEISGFAILMSFYHHLLRKREEALDYYKAAVQVDPHANGLSALEKKLFPTSLLRTIFNTRQFCEVIFSLLVALHF